MNDNRQSELLGEADLFAEALALIFGRGVVVVIVQADLAEGHDFLV